MNLATLLQDYAAYNYWANRQLVNWLSTKPAEQMEMEVPSSFPTIRLTLLHILKTQQFWLDVLQHKQGGYDDEDGASFYDSEAELSTQDVFDQFVYQSEELAAHIQTMDEEKMQESIHLVTPWFESNQPQFEFIHHCMNHSTYHRGQIVTIGRNLGLTDAPMTDYNFYLLFGK